MSIFTNKKLKINETLLAGFVIFVVIVGVLFFSKKNIENKVPLTPPLFNDNGEVVGETLINSNRDGGCFTADEVPKNNEYISYEYDGKCYINTLYSEKALVMQDILDKSYDTLYESRRYFDNEIKKLHDASKDMKFLWHPDQEKQEYASAKKEVGGEEIEESVLNVGKYKITITSPWDTLSLDDEDLYTHIVITDNGKSIDTKDYKGVAFHHVYKIQVNKTSYYILGLCAGGMHGCGILVPIINDGDKLVIGKSIEGVDFSNYLRIEDFFTKNGELYTVFDDSRYFFSYSGSNNASYNSAVPRIYKFDKTTGGIVLEEENFLEIYKQSAKMISEDMKKLNDSFPIEVKHLMTQTGSGRSLIPYFDYYLGMAIIADKSHASEIRSRVEKLYTDFYGNKYDPEAHFDGYKDFEN